MLSQRKRSTPTKGRNGSDDLGEHKADARESFFPVVLLSYCDLLEMSEAILYMQCIHRRDSIFVFAPHFIQEKLLVEMKISLDRWCRADKVKTHSTYSNASSNSANSIQSSRGLTGRANSLNNSQSLAISSSTMANVNKPSADASDQAKYLLTVSSCSMAADSLAASISVDNSNSLGRQPSFLANSSFMSTADSEVFAHLPAQSLSIDPSELAPSNKAVLIPKAPASFTASFFTAPPPPRLPSGVLPPLVSLPPLPSSLGSSSNATISSFGNSSRDPDSSTPKASIFMPDLAQSLRIPSKPLAQPPQPLLPPLPTSVYSHSSDMPHSSRFQVPPLPPLPLPRSIVRAEGIVGLAESAIAVASLTLPTDEILLDGHSSRSRSTELEDSSGPPSAGGNLSGSNSPPQRKTNSFKSKERTWVYHALMDAVQRTQKDHAVSIAVFI
ncbi:hypothetical protein EON64_00285 [archaeon]|nr:MAG: hypothetical protein EON64_00285 [archaeon]